MPHRDPKVDQVVLEVHVMKFLFFGGYSGDVISN